jgi:hypothetical protein
MILGCHQHAPLLAGVKVVRPYGALHLDPDCGDDAAHTRRGTGGKTINNSPLTGGPATDKCLSRAGMFGA